MNGNLCFSKNTFLIFIIIIISFFLLYNHFNINKCVIKSQNSTQLHDNNKMIVTNEITTNSDIDLIQSRDYYALSDPLSAPTRRLPRHIYPTLPHDYAIDIPTRGFPDNYHYIGNLIRKSDEKIIKLFGRQTYPNSNKYEYYGITSDKNGAEIKIQIKTKNNVELYDKDEINIDFLDTTEGKFILYSNDYDRPRYNPFIFY